MPNRADEDAERLGDAGTMSVVWNYGSPSAETSPAWESPRRGWKAKQGSAVILQANADRRKRAVRDPPAVEVPGRTHSDPGGDEHGIRATLDVYHIGQQAEYREASSLISKSQQLAQQFFGVPTQYKLGHGSETIRAARAESVTFDEEESMAEGSGDTGCPLVQAVVPKLCLDCGQMDGAETLKRRHGRPQSARFAPSVPKSSKDRPHSARLSEISRLTSSNVSLQSTNMGGPHPSDNPALLIELCEESRRSPRTRVSRSRSSCNSIARGHARLQREKEKRLWSGSNEPPRTENSHAANAGKNSGAAATRPSPQHPAANSSQASVDGKELYVNPYWKIGFDEEIQQRNLAVGAASKGRRNLNKNAFQRPSPWQEPPVPHQRNLSLRVRNGSLSLPPRPVEKSPLLKPRMVTPRRLPSPTLIEEMSSADEQEFEYLSVSTSRMHGAGRAEVPVARPSSHQQVSRTDSNDSCLSPALCYGHSDGVPHECDKWS